MVLAADILIWPTVGDSDYAWLVFFIIFMVAAILLINKLFARQRFEKKSQGFAINEIIGKGYNPDEAKILKRFVDLLSETERRTLVETRNWKFLKKRVYEYLLNLNGIRPETAVRIYKRLYVESGQDHSFHVGDLVVGEIVALLTSHGEELTRIMKSSQEDLLLSSPKSLIPDGTKNIGAKIYVFRPRQGGFYIEGEIVGVINQAILFHITGKPVSAGHAHLMIQEKFLVNISSWPKISSKSQMESELFEELQKNQDGEIEDEMQILEEEIRKRFSNKPKPKEEEIKPFIPEPKKDEILNIDFSCIADRLSDRGLIFELPEELDREFWKKSELWEANFQMPGGRYIATKGKIMPSTNSKSRYLMRFIDMEESERIQIYEDIKRFGGEREALS
jgi:hypothetical protein